MRHLFDENDNWTDEAHEIGLEIANAISPIVSRAVAAGVSIRDIELVIGFEAGAVCSEQKVRADIKRRKKET